MTNEEILQAVQDKDLKDSDGEAEMYYYRRAIIMASFAWSLFCIISFLIKEIQHRPDYSEMVFMFSFFGVKNIYLGTKFHLNLKLLWGIVASLIAVAHVVLFVGVMFFS